MSTLIIGLSTGLLNVFPGYDALHVLVFFQGLGFGGCDTIGNCIIPHLWGPTKRTQPWMQALHANFGVGALLGPVLVGALDLSSTNVFLAYGSIAPLLIASNELWYKSGRNSSGDADEKRADGAAAEEGKGKAEAASASDGSAAGKTSKVLPFALKALLTAFFYVYVGAEAGFGSWVSTYVLEKGVVAPGDVGAAAFVAAYYWAALTAGRILAVLLAIYFAASTMLVLQLFLAVVGGVLTVTTMGSSVGAASGVSILFGYSLSSIFPLAMTVVNDYGYEMDVRVTATQQSPGFVLSCFVLLLLLLVLLYCCLQLSAVLLAFPFPATSMLIYYLLDYCVPFVVLFLVSCGMLHYCLPGFFLCCVS